MKEIKLNPLASFFFADKRNAIVWLIIRVYLGYLWIMAGWEKIHDGAWVGSGSGKALTGFINGALQKTIGVHPDVQMWYANFLHNMVLPNVSVWSPMVAYGEFLVGLGLIVGCVVGVAAFFGTFMSFNFLMAGTVSINPILIILGFLLMLAWRVAGYIGLDYYVLPMLGKKFHR